MSFAASYLIFHSHLIEHLQDSMSSLSIRWICHKCPWLCFFAHTAFQPELPISSFHESAQVTTLLKIFSQILKAELFSIFFYFHSSLFMLLLLTYGMLSLWLVVSSLSLILNGKLFHNGGITFVIVPLRSTKVHNIANHSINVLKKC